MLKTTTLDIARIRDTVSRLIEEHHLPGVSIGVVSGDDLVYAEGFGLADIESRRAMAPELRQRIASITKTMVGLCVMALVDEGRVALEDSVVDRLPDIRFDGPAESLTIWHLLTHSGGIGEAPNIKDINDPFQLLFSASTPASPLAEAYTDGITIEVAPGAKWAYANHGFMLLGEIISRIEKSPIRDVVHRRVFEPIGMRNSDLLDRSHPDLSTGYHRQPGEDERELLLRVGREVPDEKTVDGQNIRGKYLAEWGGGAAGGVQSTIPDMARYASSLLRQSNGIVFPETFDKMVSPQWQSDLRLPAWGLGFARRSFFGRLSFGHGGSAFGGWNSYIAVFPDDDMAVLVHMNLIYDHFDSILSRIIQAVLGARTETIPEGPIDPTIFGSASGVYEAPNPGPLTNFRVITNCGRIQISARESGLVLHARRGPWKRGVRMLPIDPAQPDLFALDTGDPQLPRMVTVRDDAGCVIALHFGGSTLWTMQRNPNLKLWT